MSDTVLGVPREELGTAGQQVSCIANIFSAEEGFRDGRQKGFFDDASNLAAAVRLEYAGVRDLAVGTSYWTGNTGFEFPDISANARLFELDARYRIGRFDLRGQYVTTRLEDSAELNRALQRRSGINPNIAEEMLGYYLESAVHLRPRTARIGLAVMPPDPPVQPICCHCTPSKAFA